MVEGTPDYDAIANKVMQPSIYEEAMEEIGYAHEGADNKPWTMMDGVTFDPSGDMEAYAKSFAIKNVKG